MKVLCTSAAPYCKLQAPKVAVWVAVRKSTADPEAEGEIERLESCGWVLCMVSSSTSSKGAWNPKQQLQEHGTC